jgi:hypothetical protein
VLGLPPTRESLEKAAAAAALRPELREALRDGNLSVLAPELNGRLSHAGQRRVADLVRPLSQNKQREVLLNLIDLGRREGCPPEMVLAAAVVAAALRGDEGVSPLQRAETVRRLLDEKKNAVSSARRKVVGRVLGRLRLPPGAVIRPPDSFEDDEFSLVMRFASRKDLKALAEDVARLATSPEFDGLFPGTRGQDS